MQGSSTESFGMVITCIFLPDDKKDISNLLSSSFDEGLGVSWKAK